MIIIPPQPTPELRDKVLDAAEAKGHCIIWSPIGFLVMQDKDLAAVCFHKMSQSYAQITASEVAVMAFVDGRGKPGICYALASGKGAALYGVPEDEYVAAVRLLGSDAGPTHTAH